MGKSKIGGATKTNDIAGLQAELSALEERTGEIVRKFNVNNEDNTILLRQRDRVRDRLIQLGYYIHGEGIVKKVNPRAEVERKSASAQSKPLQSAEPVPAPTPTPDETSAAPLQGEIPFPEESAHARIKMPVSDIVSPTPQAVQAVGRGAVGAVGIFEELES